VLTHREIFEIAFGVLNKKVKISGFPLWIRNIMLGLARTFTSVNIYGPLEFFMTVLSMDLVAPKYGKHHLKDFFLENR